MKHLQLLRSTKKRRQLSVVSVIALAYLLYLLGATFLLMAIIVVLSVLYLPVPRLFASGLSRLVIISVVTIGLVQIAALLQFILLPQTDFTVVALLYAVMAAGILGYSAGKFSRFRGRLLSTNDLFALVIAILFLLPFTPIIMGQDSAYKITQIGGLQAPDAEHHFGFISTMSDRQQLDTTGYPKSFHLALAFVQDAVGFSQHLASWKANVFVFFAQYMVLGATLGYVLYYACAFFIRQLAGEGDAIKHSIAWGVATALALGLPLAILVLWPFLVQGFLNFYFVIIALTLSLLYLFEYAAQKTKALADPALLLGALLAIAVGAAWPLLIPVLLATIILFTLTGRTVKISEIVSIRLLPLALLLGLLLLPLLLQIMHPSPSTNINDHGGLRTFDTLLLLGGLALLGFTLTRAEISATFRKSLLNACLPLTIFTGLLVFWQLFTVGEVRYFAIKVSLILEILLLVLGVAWLVNSITKTNRNKWLYVFALPFLPLTIIALLLSPTANPLKSIRDLFRDYSGQGKPAFYDQDAFHYSGLGKEGKIDHFNSTVLHYNAMDGKLYAHSLLAQWAQFLKHPPDQSSVAAKSCHRLVYHNLVYGAGSAGEQAALIEKIKECAGIAAQAGRPYYIITDNMSLPFIKSMFGQKVEYVSS